MKLALGTAQFGMAYGVANRLGQVDFAMARAIIECARRNGIDTIDTAIGYADSEKVLGRIGVADMRVITKISEVPADVSDVRQWVVDQIDGSLNRLRIDQLAGVLLHRPDQLTEPQGPALAAALAFLKDSGRVAKIGVSVYAPEDLEALLIACPIDLVQAPLSIIDRRLVSSGWLARLNKVGIEVHARSLFLQGLLLMSPADRPTRFNRWDGLWRQWDDWVERHPVGSAQAACIAFAEKQDLIDRIVVGVDSVIQLEELIVATRRHISAQVPDISSNDEQLINPALWSTS